MFYNKHARIAQIKETVCIIILAGVVGPLMMLMMIVLS